MATVTSSRQGPLLPVIGSAAAAAHQPTLHTPHPFDVILLLKVSFHLQLTLVVLLIHLLALIASVSPGAHKTQPLLLQWHLEDSHHQSASPIFLLFLFSYLV